MGLLCFLNPTYDPMNTHGASWIVNNNGFRRRLFTVKRRKQAAGGGNAGTPEVVRADVRDVAPIPARVRGNSLQGVPVERFVEAVAEMRNIEIH